MLALRVVAVPVVAPVVWLTSPLLTVVAAVPSVKLPPPEEEAELLPVVVDPCVCVLRAGVSDVVGPVTVDLVGVGVGVGVVTTVGILLPVAPVPVPPVLCVDELATVVTELVPVVTVGFRGGVFPVPVVVFVVVVGVLSTLLPGVVELDIGVDVEVNLHQGQSNLTLVRIAPNIIFEWNGTWYVACSDGTVE